MKLIEGKSKTERNKIIAAIVLGVLALVSLGYMFFGDSFSSRGSANANGNNSNRNTRSSSTTRNNAPTQEQTEEETISDNIAKLVYERIAPPSVGGGRNIFDIYIPPPKPSPVYTPPPPSPTPKPPQDLYSISPANIFARTSDFTIQVMGDKFTPETKIVFDNNELPTRFISPQQLSATVPASLFATDGARQIMVRTPDGMLYSNTATLNVMAPPVPNYLYIGLIGDKRYKDDVALLRDKNDAKILFSLRLGETINEKSDNRFQVVSISEREVIVIDKQLKVKHSLPYTTGDKTNASNNDLNQFQRPNQRGFPQEIPGIPSNIPRYVPPQQQKGDDDDDDDNPNNSPVKRP
jgi:hypothetical protein